MNLVDMRLEKPWVTKEIKHLVAEKHRYFKDYKLTQSAESLVSFKKFCNLVNRKLKEAQNQFSEEKQQSKHDRNWWEWQKNEIQKINM